MNSIENDDRVRVVRGDLFSMKEFMDMIRPYPIVLNCSKITEVVAEKERTVAFLLKEYEKIFCVPITRQKFLKKLNNLKTRFRMSIRYFEKNKLPIKLKPWEKVLAEMLKKNRIPFRIKGIDGTMGEAEIHDGESINLIENKPNSECRNDVKHENRSENSVSMHEDDDSNNNCSDSDLFNDSPFKQLIENQRLYPVISQILKARTLAEQISLQQNRSNSPIASHSNFMSSISCNNVDKISDEPQQQPSTASANFRNENNRISKKQSNEVIPGEADETKNLTKKQLERLALIEHIESSRIQKEYYAEKLKLLKQKNNQNSAMDLI